MASASTQRSVTYRSRLYVLFTGSALSVALFVFFYFSSMYSRQALDGARSEATSIADITGYSAATGLSQHDSVALSNVLAATSQNPDVRFIIILDSANTIRAAYEQEIAERIGYQHATHLGVIDPSGSTVLARETITENGTPIGAIVIGLCLDRITREVMDARKNITVISAIILLVGLGVVVLVTRLLVRPLESMAREFHGVAMGGAGNRITSPGYREIDVVAEAFNDMIERLNALQGELQSVNRSLEKRIEERTVDLQKAIDQYRRTEEALRESEERYRVLVDLSPDAIAVHSGSGFVFVNPSVFTMFRVSSGTSLIGRSIYEFMHPAQSDLFRETFVKILSGTQSTLMADQQFVRSDGTEFIAEVSATRMMFRGTAALQFVIRDISERVRSERRRVELEQQLLHVQKKEIVSTLASGLAHDILNILGIIGTSINKLLFLKEVSQQSLTESADQISKATERGKSLVRQLLTFARKSELNFDPVNVNTVVSEITSVIQRTFPPTIAIRTDLGNDLPAVRADQNQLHQALLNLCLNARDAIQETGLITIATTTAIRPSVAGTAQPGPEYLCISVSDDGIGMNEEILKRIYEPFFTTKNEGTGSGLGLAMVKGIMENHRGTIEVDSSLHKGTTFRLFLPI